MDTVKSRSSNIKDSPSVKRLEKRVCEIKKKSIENSQKLLNQAIDSFKRNDIEVKFAKSSNDAIDIIQDLIKDFDSKIIAKSKSNTLGEINFKKIFNSRGFEIIDTDLDLSGSGCGAHASTSLPRVARSCIKAMIVVDRKSVV